MSKGLNQTLVTGGITPKRSVKDVIKAALKKFNVPFADDCCPDTLTPVAFDTEDDTLKYYDVETGTWVAVPENGG